MEMRELIGEDQLLLSIYLYIYPYTTADIICILIHVNGGNIYEQYEVTKRCADLGTLQKRSIKEWYAAFGPILLRKID